MGNLLSSDAVEAKPNDQQIVCKPPPPKAELYSHEVPGTRTANRGAAHVGGGEDVFDPQSTLYTNLLNRKKVDPDGTRPLFGWRKIDPETKEAGPYEWINMNEFLPQVEACASGMHTQLGTERGALIGLFSKNRYEWCLVEHACSRMAYTIVPLYDTLGPTAVPFIMNHTEMKVVFCAKAQFKTLMGCIHECPTVKTVVQFEDDVDNEERELADKSSVRLLTLADVVAHGKTNIVPADPPTPDDIATICYTSGTTGDPKGVMLSHSNMMAEEAAGEYSTCTYPGDIHISYLPLAHVYERSLHATVIKNGGGIGFYQGDVSKIVDDLQALRPTLFVTVPRLLNRVHDKITQGLASAPTAKRFVFERAYNSKKRHLADGHLSHAVWDRVVFDKLKALLGGRVRLIVIGSAPVSKEVKQFFQIVFGCPVLEGYGLTETCAGICCSLEPMDAGNHVGVPLPGVQMCLEDVPEMNYTSNDTPLPRGEILIKGPVVFAGYYKQPELTQQSKDNDGWFHTGDVGCWNANGTLSVIDRKKNIFKLSQGEYVAPEKIEAIYAKSPLVAQAYVHGNSLQNFLVGVVMPDPEIIKEWAAQRGKDASLEKLCEDEDLRAAVAEDLEELGKRMKLFRFERIQKLVLTAEGFTQENDLMTPTFKLKRAQIAKRFASEIDAMYGIDPKNPRKF